MADVYLLLLGFLVVLAAGTVLAVIIRQGRRRQQELRSPVRLREQLKETDAYLRRISQAATEEELDRLDEERER